MKAQARQADPRTGAEREAAQAVAAEHREAYIRGHQLAGGRQKAESA